MESEVRRIAAESGIGLQGLTILEASDAAAAAVASVRSGEARMLMKGQVSTPSLMRAVLDPVEGLRSDRVICQVVLMEIRSVVSSLPVSPTESVREEHARRLLLADTGICIQPTLEQKSEILRSAVHVANALGEATPRVALLAATETVTEAMPETLVAAELQRRGQAGEFPGCAVQGPLSFDLACDSDAAAKKSVRGPVVGAADILLFPNLVTANLTVKAIMYTANCRFGGILCGAACPVAFMSRADTTATRLHSLALAIRLASTAQSRTQV
jgi:phosphotransacetylase